MLKELFVNSMENFDKECLFVESTLGDFWIEDFTICVDKNFITIKGSEYDRFLEEQNGLIRGLKIDLNKLTDYENYSEEYNKMDITIGINNGEHYARFYNYI